MKATVLRTLILVFGLAAVFSPKVEGGLLVHRKTPRSAWQTQFVLGPKTSLIQGNSLNGWTTVNGRTPPSAWSVTDGVLSLHGKGGDLISEREYENFRLDFTWTISKGGNSGIKYRYKKFEGKGWLGPEYQVLDDFNTAEGKKPKNCTATLYDILPTNDQKKLNPHTEKNYGRIVVIGDRLEHWLNGKKVVSVTVGSTEWDEAIAKSKFSNVEGYGKNALGRIMVQDHQCDVQFHDISIREISKQKAAAKATGTRTNYHKCRHGIMIHRKPLRASKGILGVIPFRSKR